MSTPSTSDSMLHIARSALPLLITRADVGPDPILLLSGPDWAANFLCNWLLEGAGHRLDRDYSGLHTPDDAIDLTTADLGFLVGRHIEAITSDAEMIDPVFHISGGIELKVYAETDVAPWVFSLPGITLVGRSKR